MTEVRLFTKDRREVMVRLARQYPGIHYSGHDILCYEAIIQKLEAEIVSLQSHLDNYCGEADCYG